MSILQAVVLVVGVLVAAVASDLLHNSGRTSWPLAIAVLAVGALAGYLYSSWLASFDLGLGVGWLLVGGHHKVTAFLEKRRVEAEMRESARRRGVIRDPRP